MATGSRKVLLVANTDWYLYNFRLALARFLRDQGLEVVMAAPKGEYAAKIQEAGFRFIAWDVDRRAMSPAGEARAIFRMAKIYRDEKPFLVHHFTVKPVLYGTLAAKLVKIPSVVNAVTGLGYIFLSEGWRGNLLRRLILPFYRSVLSGKNIRVIFENENDRGVFKDLGLVNDNNNVVIHGVGVDEDYFAPVPEPCRAEPLIVFPARMLLDKGLETLVDAARILKPRHKVRIALVGNIDPGNPTGVDESTIRAWEEEGLVEWWGFRSDMRAVYQDCNLVTLPSFGEGLPTALIEAAACGRAIVTTDVPGCREVVEDGINGLLVPPKQPAALAQAIEKLVNEPELRAQMGKAGRQIMVRDFTESLVIKETFKVYCSLVGQPDLL